MSPARSAILDALADLGSIVVDDALTVTPTVYAARPDQMHDGAIWPVAREFAREGVLSAPMTTAYDVYVVVPNALASQTADAAEALIAPLIDALELIGVWTQPAQLVQLELDNSPSIPALAIRVQPYA